MKKRVYHLFCVCALCFHLAAQETERPADCDITSGEARRKPVLGFKAGLNRSNVYDQGAERFFASSRTGAVGGMWVSIPVGSFIGIQPELLLSQKGFDAEGQIGAGNYELSRTTTHLDLPVQLQLKPFSWLSILTGVHYSYVLRQRDEFVQNNNYEAVSLVFKNDNFRRNLAGIVLGADINFWHVVFSGRTGWDLIANHGDGTSSTPRYKNLWFQATIGYRIY